MWEFFKSNTETSPNVEPAIAILKIIGLEDFFACANEFYDRLPKFMALQRPSFDKLLDNIIYRVSFAIMNPQILERFQGVLPIERDMAGYFFVTPELKALKKATYRNVSPAPLPDPNGPASSGKRGEHTHEALSPEKDFVHQALKSQLETGLLALRNLSIFRYLAVSSKNNISQNLQESIIQVSEALSLLSRSAKMRDRYAREAQIETYTKEIIGYEKNILPKLRLAAQILQSLYFDLNNFFLGCFSDENLERVTKEALGEGYPKDSIGGYFPVLMSERVYTIAKQKKTDYLEHNRQVIQARLYAPLALLLFRQNLIRDSEFSDEVLKALNKLKIQEFLRYNANLDYHGYCDHLRLKKDLRSFISPVITEIFSYSDNPSMVTGFLGLFQSLETKDKGLASLAGKQSLDIFNHAWSNQWHNLLASDIRMFAEVVKDQKLLRALFMQTSGELFLMLRNPGFRSYLRQANIETIDFALLYKFFSRDEKLFTQIYPKLIVTEKPAVVILAKLISSPEVDVSGIVITDTMCKFLINLSGGFDKTAKEIIFLLKNFPLAERALFYGYTPFAQNLGEIKDAAAFAAWFFEHSELLVKKIELAQRVAPYMADSKDQELRAALVLLLAKHGEEFLKSFSELRYFGQSRNLQDRTYARIANLFALLANAKRLSRRREIVIMVQYLASFSPSEVWNDFCAQFIQIDGNTVGDYSLLFEKYHADLILKSSETKCDIEGVGLLVDTYSALDADKQKNLIERFIMVLSVVVISSEIVKEICLRIRKKHYSVTDFALTQLEKGKFPTEVLEIINRYSNDEEFRNHPPDD